MKQWVERHLGSVATLQRGFDLPHRERQPGNVPIVTSAGPGGTHNKAMVEAPGVVTGRYGTIGKVFFLDQDFWPLNTTLWVSNFHGNDERFIYYLLQRVDYATHSGKSGVPGVNRNDLHTETVVLPTDEAEQRKIAAAICTIDGLVDSLQLLIVKKQNIKQGILQELLSGKIRLQGFNDDWPSRQLRSIATGGRGAGLSKSDIQSNGKYPCILYGELFTTYNRVVHEVVSQTDQAGTVVSIGNEVLLPGSTTTSAEDLATATALLQPGVLLGGDINIIRPNRSKVDPVWLAYYLVQERSRQIAESSQGITIVHLYVKSLLNLEIALPSLEEQQAIARVLLDVDSEISALERRLKSARAIKQGMMQELLTGRTRLITEAAL